MEVEGIKNPQQEGTALVSLTGIHRPAMSAARPWAVVPFGAQASPQAIGATPLSWEITDIDLLKDGRQAVLGRGHMCSSCSQVGVELMLSGFKVFVFKGRSVD